MSMGTAVFCREAMVARREEGRRWAEVAGVWDVGEDSTRRGRRVAAMSVCELREEGGARGSADVLLPVADAWTTGPRASD
jgi:hypothetical protein